MGIPATIEFLSSLRSSLQLLVIKNRIKTTTKKPKGIKLKFTQNIYMSTLKQGMEFRFRNANSRWIMPAHYIESYFKQQSLNIIIKWKIVVMCC